MIKIVPGLIAVVLSAMFTAQAGADNGGLMSLRGQTELDTESSAEAMKRIPKDQLPLDREFVHQPPLIPHQIRGYKIDTNSNKCLSCHSWKNARRSGATRISVTHFMNREGQQLADVAPSRYFCLQCHTTQADAKPLVKNRFQPVDSLNQN